MSRFVVGLLEDVSLRRVMRLLGFGMTLFKIRQLVSPTIIGIAALSVLSHEQSYV
jgi:hypothetical protein